MVGLAAQAQAPLAPPPQIRYGVSVSTESAKNVAATSIAEAHKNTWKMAIAIVDRGVTSFILKVNAGRPDRKCRIGDRESAYSRSIPAADQTLPGALLQNAIRRVNLFRVLLGITAAWTPPFTTF